MTTPAFPLTPALAARLDGATLLLLLDIDGTLAPIAGRPTDVALPVATKWVIDELARTPRVNVAIVTGRSAADGRRIVGLGNVWVIGNHGIELAAPFSDPKPRPDVARFGGDVAAAAVECLELERANVGVIVEDKRWTLSVHYRLADPAIVALLAARVDEIARNHHLRVTLGKQVLELRPPIDIHKGTAAVELARRLGALADTSAILCAGDDRTDEDAFRALRDVKPSAVTIRVGSDAVASQTTAEFFLPDPDAVRELLSAVLERRRRVKD